MSPVPERTYGRRGGAVVPAGRGGLVYTLIRGRVLGCRSDPQFTVSMRPPGLPPPRRPFVGSDAGIHMIEALKSDAIADKVGGRFKLCALIQRRLVQLMEGSRPLVERNGRSDLELVIEEILQDKITLDYIPQQALPPGADVDDADLLTS
jgi:DNA-directed RNA polymerase subunit omega